MKIKAALAWIAAVCALLAFTVASRAQGTGSDATLAPGDHHRWMGELFERKPQAINQSLARFIIPGTHDSGTFGLTSNAACEDCPGADRFFDVDSGCRSYLPPALHGVCDSAGSFMSIVGKSWGEAQHLTVGGLLDAGARHFDLRFFRATIADQARTSGQLVAGTFYIHHSLAGPDSTVILNDIQQFLDQPSNAQEIVILEFSKMKQGDGEMDAATIGFFFDQVRTRFGGKMAKKQNDACVSNPAGCSATERFGDATTLRDFLAQGSQVIVTCASCNIEAEDIWSSITWTTPSGVSGINGDPGEGYPAPDNDYFPWRTDREYVSIIQQLSVKRDSYPQDEMFALGTQIGLDDGGVSMIRGLTCSLDPGNISGECGAVNDDWDEFQGLRDVAEFTNPMALAAIVGLRRDRVNIVTFDHYTKAITEEIFKLNFGATQVRLNIDRVTENDNAPLDSLDFDSDPDYYPVFFFPGVPPTTWDPRPQRYNQIQNGADIPGPGWAGALWPAWKAYPNDWGTAEIGFGINDADGGLSGDDDRSVIRIPLPGDPNPDLFRVKELVPITDCVASGASCLSISKQLTTSGLTADDSSTVYYRRSACVWSWLPGDIVDIASLCGEDLPELTVYDGVRVEGDSGSTAIEFVFSLSAPLLKPLTVTFSTGNGTALAGSDYIDADKTELTFAAGETRVIAKVFVNGDTDYESDETFTVTVFSAPGAEIVDDSATGTIVNDDAFDGPAVASPGPQSGNEGSAITFALGTLTDGRSGAGPWSIDVTWGDGSSDTFSVSAPGPLSRSHTYADNGTYTVGVSATAADSVAADPISFTATIANVAPEAVLGSTGPIAEGGTVLVSFTAPFDPSSVDTTAGFHYAFSCSNSSLAAATYAGSGTATAVQCTYDDNGPRTVRARIIDKDGGYTEYTRAVSVTNVAPTATLGNNGPVNEGGTVTITFSNPSDPSAADTAAGFRYAYSCTNASLAAATYVNSSTAATTSCTFADDGVYTVRGRIIDKNGGATEYTTAVTVLDLASVLTAPPNQSGSEGSSLAFDLGKLEDASADGPWAITVNWGDTSTESFSVTTLGAIARSHTYADNGAYTVNVSAKDADNVASNTATFTATIANVKPTITAGGSAVDENGLASVSGTISDPGVLDTFAITVSWGDGSSSQYSLPAGATSYTATHTYLDDNPTATASDVSTVMVAIADKDGGNGGASTSVTIGNTAPQVGSLAFEDESGAAIGDPYFALSGLPVDLEAAFTDVGMLDTHQSSINWGDGTSGAGTVTGSGGTGTVTAQHTWNTVGTFTVGLTLTDDDTGVGTRQATIAVTDAKGAVCALVPVISPMASDRRLSNSIRSALTQLLGQIQGNIFDARAANGACDLFAKNNYEAAVVKLQQAVQTIEGVITARGLTSAQVTVLRQVETRLVLAAKWTAVTLSRTTTDPQKLATVAALGQLADAALASGDYITAVAKWLEAVRLLVSLT